MCFSEGRVVVVVWFGFLEFFYFMGFSYFIFRVSNLWFRYSSLGVVT